MRWRKNNELRLWSLNLSALFNGGGGDGRDRKRLWNGTEAIVESQMTAQPWLTFQISRVRDMERELNYLREESENILTIRDSLPNFCPKSTELCLEDQC